ncbi:MAG: DUF6273 domain-containing protein [Clostridiaceae bacterium]|nr:DUF6273 domain-containing protein [Clostridiaceae bacterium]
MGIYNIKEPFGGDNIFSYRKKFPSFIFFIILTGIQFQVLFGSGTVGLSDNGDYVRVMKPNYIVNIGDSSYNRFTFVETYHLEPEGATTGEKTANAILRVDDPASYPSLQHFFIKLGIIANIVYNRITGGDIFTFHIGAMGILYVVMYSASLAILMEYLEGKSLLQDIIIKAIAAVIFCDIGYIAYFNSFYGEAPQLILFILSAALGIRLMKRKASKLDIILVYAALTAFAWTKFANIPVAALVLAFTAVPVFLLGRGISYKLNTITALAISFFALASIWSSVPEWMNVHTNYNAIFFGILREEKAPEPVIRELGLPEYMKDLAGTTYYSLEASGITSSEIFNNDFSRLSKPDIALYYLRHPGILAEKLRISAKHSGFIRPAYLSNRDITYSRLVFDDSFALWSRIRKRLPFNTIWFNVMICLLFAVLAAAAAFKGRNEIRIGAALVLSLLCSALFNFCMPVISNGEADLAKHMFAFVCSMDLMILVSTYLFINMMHSFYGHGQHKSAAMFLLIVMFLSGYGYFTSVEEVGMPYYVELGEYNGKKLLWQVIEDGREGYLLICSSAVAVQPFSAHADSNRLGSNLWKDSSLRAWLNTEFLRGFKPWEKELILDCENKYLLSRENIPMKKSGDREFFWTHIPELADRGYDRAYYDICVDKVFLPDIRDISNAFRSGADIRREGPYWLETPYFYDTSMVRTVFPDGYIYMKDAAMMSIGVVPAMRIKPINIRR